jgi:hypothetical protein
MVKYTCPCCGYKTLDEEPPAHMIFAVFAFGKMMVFNFETLITKEGQMIFH